VLNPLFKLGIKVDVMCIAGNHGSSQHKGMDMFKAGLFSYDYTIYKTFELLAKSCGYNHVQFIIPEGVFGYLNIYGNYAVYEHGYFNSSTEKSMSDQMKKRGQQIKKHVEYFRCGDKHHACSYDTHRIVLNGAFFGVDEGGVEYSGLADITGYGYITANPNAIWGGYGSVTGTASVIANGTNLGHNWTPVPVDTNTWSDVAVNANSWTDVAVSANTWSDVSVNTNTWVDVLVNNNEWYRQG
jgi:hypothetical protein